MEGQEGAEGNQPKLMNPPLWVLFTLNYCWTLLNFHFRAGTVQTVPKNLDWHKEPWKEPTLTDLIYLSGFFGWCQKAAGHLTHCLLWQSPNKPPHSLHDAGASSQREDLSYYTTQGSPLCLIALCVCVCVSRHKSTQAVFEEVVLRGHSLNNPACGSFEEAVSCWVAGQEQ